MSQADKVNNNSCNELLNRIPLNFPPEIFCASGNGVTGGVPFGFDVGISETPFAKNVIKGMDQGVQGMRVGGVVSGDDHLVQKGESTHL